MSNSPSNAFKFWVLVLAMVGVVYYAYTQRWARDSSRDLDRSLEAARTP